MYMERGRKVNRKEQHNCEQSTKDGKKKRIKK